METPKKYTVTICRTTVETRDYEVEADTPEEAEGVAHDRAADELWLGSANVDYDTDSVREHD